MAVYKDNKGYWSIRWRDKETKKTRQKNFGKGPLAEAEARKAFKEMNVRAWGQLREQNSPKFRELVREYWNFKKNESRPSTLSGMAPKIKSIILPALGDVLACDMTERKMNQYIEKRLKEGVKSSTVRRDMEYIRAIMNWSKKKGLIIENPMKNMDLPRRDYERIRPPPVDEISAIYNHSPPHLQRFIQIAWNSGARVGQEILTIRWKDVDWHSQTMYVVSAEKGGLDTRDVPVNENLFPLLQKWYAKDWLYLWDPPRTIRGKLVREPVPVDQIKQTLDDMTIIWYLGKQVSSIKKAWASAKKKAGITRRLRPYDIRHSFVTNLLEQGENPAVVGDVAGHKDKSTTMYVYQHVFHDAHRRAVNKQLNIKTKDDEK